MPKRWIVVDTNIFRLTGFEKAGDADLRQRTYRDKGFAAIGLLERIVNQCEEYGLALDEGGLIIEEYEEQIPENLYGFELLVRMTEIPGKVRVFAHKNPRWLNQMSQAHKLDKHDRRFLATTLATPDKILVSEDGVFLDNRDFLAKKGVRVYDAEEADESL